MLDSLLIDICASLALECGVVWHQCDRSVFLVGEKGLSTNVFLYIHEEALTEVEKLVGWNLPAPDPAVLK